MFKLTKTLILLNCLIVAVPAFTAEPGNDSRQEMRALKVEQGKLKVKERLLKLKHALNLQPNQMKAWTNYETEAINQVDKKMLIASKLRQKKAKTGKPITSIDLAKANITRLENQLTTAKERLVVFSKFYNVLNKEQQATIDKLAHKKVKRTASALKKAKQAGSNKTRKSRKKMNNGS